jgi:diguanylate cyclase (GGDEF)-like protein/PAS domain S-box-containing protein
MDGTRAGSRAVRRDPLAAAVDHLPELVVLCDETGQVLAVNGTAAATIGVPAAELVGRSAFSFVHPDDIAYAIGCLASRMDDPGRPGLPVRVRVITPAGPELAVEMIGCDLRHVPDVGAIVVTVRDLTYRPALADEPWRLRALVDRVGDLILLVDADGVVRFANQALDRVLGLDCDRAVGTRWLELIHPEDQGGVTIRFAALVAGSQTQDRYRCRIRHADGSVRVMEVQAHDRLTDPDIAGVVVSARDVTELADAEARFEEIFAEAPSGTVLLSADCHVVRVNHVAADLVGRTEADLIGRPLAEVLPGAVAVAMAEGLARVRSGSVRRVRAEEQVVRVDGEVLWVSVAAAIVRGADGAVRHIVLHLEDVTARREAEQRLRQENEWLELRASHDPLTGLPNRTLLAELLAEQVRPRRPCPTLLFCDLDGFKDVNDALGHEAGDAVLVEVAARLRDAVRATDVVTRYAGDEFVVVCEGPLDVDVAAGMAQRICDAVQVPVALPAGGEVRVGVSIGVAAPRGGDTPASLLDRADRAMYQAKRAEVVAPTAPTSVVIAA